MGIFVGLGKEEEQTSYYFRGLEGLQGLRLIDWFLMFGQLLSFVHGLFL